MQLQNRVTPEGRIIADKGRGLFMGNRGILHDAEGQIVRKFASRAWIICQLSFRNRTAPVPLVRPGSYTRLFFLDEAVAFAAGHRPCSECRRADYNRFRAAWSAVGRGGPPRAAEMDGCLHSARITPCSGQKVTYTAALASLPDGCFILRDGCALLVLGDALVPFGQGGYGPARPRGVSGDVTVLTPARLVSVLHGGYAPVLHPSARRIAT